MKSSTEIITLTCTCTPKKHNSVHLMRTPGSGTLILPPPRKHHVALIARAPPLLTTAALKATAEPPGTVPIMPLPLPSAGTCRSSAQLAPRPQRGLLGPSQCRSRIRRPCGDGRITTSSSSASTQARTVPRVRPHPLPNPSLPQRAAASMHGPAVWGQKTVPGLHARAGAPSKKPHPPNCGRALWLRRGGLPSAHARASASCPRVPLSQPSHQHAHSGTWPCMARPGVGARGARGASVTQGLQAGQLTPRAGPRAGGW